MATEDKKIKFSASDDGMSSFMKKMREEAKSLYETFSNESKKQSQSAKEQFKIIQDQLKAYREALKLQKEITQEKLKQAKKVLETEPAFTNEGASRRAEAKREQYKAERDLADISAREKQVNAARDYANNNKPANQKPEKESRSSVFNDIVKAGFFRDMMSVMRSVPSQENGLGLMSPFAAASGGIAGAGAGYVADLITKVFTAGQLDLGLSAKLGSAGKEIGGFGADAITRSYRIRDQYDQSYNQYRARGGNESSLRLSSMGYDDIAVANQMSQNTQVAGTGRGAQRRSLTALALSRGYGIDEGTSMAAFGMERSGGGQGGLNMQKALGVAIAEGLDRAKFSDAIRTQTQLLQQFSETKTNVSSVDANRTMFEFNRMGGMFSLGDPRSMSNIMKVDEGLSNPGSDFAQAQNYKILRRLNPKADIYELLKQQEQGLQTPGFLEAVLSDIDSSSGSEAFKKLQLKSRTKLNFEANETLWSNRDKVGSMSEPELSKMLGLNQAQKEAEKLTSQYTRMNAEVTNAFRDDFAAGIKTLSTQFVTDMSRAIIEVSALMGVGGKKENAPIYVPVGSKTPVASDRYRVPAHNTPAEGDFFDIINPPALNGSYH